MINFNKLWSITKMSIGNQVAYWRNDYFESSFLNNRFRKCESGTSKTFHEKYQILKKVIGIEYLLMMERFTTSSQCLLHWIWEKSLFYAGWKNQSNVYYLQRHRDLSFSFDLETIDTSFLISSNMRTMNMIFYSIIEHRYGISRYRMLQQTKQMDI